VARDDDGINPALKFIDEDTLGWVESGSQGLLGDWIICAGIVPELLFISGFEQPGFFASTLRRPAIGQLQARSVCSIPGIS